MSSWMVRGTAFGGNQLMRDSSTKSSARMHQRTSTMVGDQGRIQGVLWVLKNPPSGKIHYKLSRGGFRGGFGCYHQP